MNLNEGPGGEKLHVQPDTQTKDPGSSLQSEKDDLTETTMQFEQSLESETAQTRTKAELGNRMPKLDGKDVYTINPDGKVFYNNLDYYDVDKTPIGSYSIDPSSGKVSYISSISDINQTNMSVDDFYKKLSDDKDALSRQRFGDFPPN